MQMKKFEEVGITPVEQLQDEITRMKEHGRKWQRLTSLMDACASKVAGLKKNSTRLDEAEAELADLKKQTAAAAIELGATLNTIFVRKRLTLLDSVVSYLELQQNYIDQYRNIIAECLPQLKSSRSALTEQKASIDEAVKRVAQSVSEEACQTGQLQGYLYRKTKMNFTRRSWFILENGVLSCHENAESHEPKWKIEMLTCTVKPSPDATRNFCFDIINPYKSRTLQADSQDTMNKWIHAIQESISAQLDKQRIGKPGRRSSGSSNPEQAAEEARKREEDINALYEADAGNKVCADCSEAKPTWISINLGILLCLECSGVHRSMGTHYSKVRSLTLDSLHHETKAYILALGNSRLNDIFNPDILTAIPTSFGERLHPNSTRKEREAWIKAKYIEKIFVETYRGPSIQNDLVAAIKQQDLPLCMKLYAQGANLNYSYESDCSRSPLHYGADGGNALLMTFLLQNGANANGKDSTGMTPLHVAASGNVSTAAVLCRLRAKVDATDNQGKTPLDVALDAQNADMITLLRLAKLVKEGGGLDDKSFAEALDSFSMEVHARQPAPASSKSLRASSPSRKTSAHPTSVTSSSPPTSASNSALSTSPEADLSSSAPTPASSFSFSSKLDKKK